MKFLLFNRWTLLSLFVACLAWVLWDAYHTWGGFDRRFLQGFCMGILVPIAGRTIAGLLTMKS